jgi:hypothetical protein
VLDLLAEKFAKTSTEKEVFEQIIGFGMKDGETYEQYKDKFQSLLTDCEREDVPSKFRYLMLVMFIDRPKQHGKLNAEEVRRLNDVIEKDDGSDRVAKGEGEVVNLIMKEYKKLKIENRDADNDKKDDIGNVHYAENRSRWN